MIKEFEFYHGAIFIQLIHSLGKNTSIRSFLKESNSSYIINEKIGVYIKYSTKRMSPWRFSFQKIHQDEISAMKNKFPEVFLILVCRDDGVVILNYNELKKILNEDYAKVEWISAVRNPGKEYRLKGSDGSLIRKIGKNDFPKKIIQAIAESEKVTTTD